MKLLGWFVAGLVLSASLGASIAFVLGLVLDPFLGNASTTNEHIISVIVFFSIVVWLVNTLDIKDTHRRNDV